MSSTIKNNLLASTLANPSSSSMAEMIERYHYADIAAALDHYSITEIVERLALVSVQKRAKLYGYLSDQNQLELLDQFSDKDFGQLFMHMQHDKRADLFNRLSDDLKLRLAPLLGWQDQNDIRQLASYDEHSVGSIMTSDYALVGANQTASEAVTQLRSVAANVETIYQPMIIDADHRLIGTVSLRELLIAPTEQIVSEFMVSSPVSIHVNADREEAARTVMKYDLLVLPVIDDEHRLLGIVTYDDAMDVANEEASIDLHKVGGLEEFVGSLKDAAITTLYKKRVFWLVLLVFGNLFSGIGIAYFEDTIAAHVALVFFLPLLIGSAGNAGSQSATLMVRALATGDVQFKDWGWMLMREFLIAGLLGLTMASAVWFLGWWRGGYEIAVVVALTMQIVVVLGSIIGMSLPFILERFNLDPATASAPLVASLSDICGVLVYFSMATYILNLA